MEYKMKVESLSHEDLVNLLSTATYGNDGMGVDYSGKCLEYHCKGDCFEDSLAYALEDGKPILVFDYYAEGETYGELEQYILEDDEIGCYYLTLEDILKGINNNQDAGEYAKTLFVDEDGDMFTAYNLLQIIVFGEEIYG